MCHSPSACTDNWKFKNTFSSLNAYIKTDLIKRKKIYIKLGKIVNKREIIKKEMKSRKSIGQNYRELMSGNEKKK